MPKPLSIGGRRPGWSFTNGSSTWSMTRWRSGPGRRRVARGIPGGDGRAKVARHVIQAAAAHQRGDPAAGRPRSGRRWRCWWRSGAADDGPVVVVSPAGPLTRSELELVEVAGDPLALIGSVADGAGGASGRRGGWARPPRVGISGYDVDRRQHPGRHARVVRRGPGPGPAPRPDRGLAAGGAGPDRPATAS